MGLVTNNISEISLRSSKDTYSSVAFETARFNCDTCVSYKNLNEFYKNRRSMSKQSLMTISRDPETPVHSQPHHKRIRSESSSVISTAKHNVNKILHRQKRSNPNLPWKKLPKRTKNYFCS